MSRSNFTSLASIVIIFDWKWSSTMVCSMAHWLTPCGHGLRCSHDTRLNSLVLPLPGDTDQGTAAMEWGVKLPSALQSSA